MSQCSVKYCRQLSCITHKPLNMSLCQEHWEKYCDGVKLEIGDKKEETAEPGIAEKKLKSRICVEILQDFVGKKGREFKKGQILNLREKLVKDFESKGYLKRK